MLINLIREQILDARFDVKGSLIKNIEKGLQFRSPWTVKRRTMEAIPGYVKNVMATIRLLEICQI